MEKITGRIVTVARTPVIIGKDITGVLDAHIDKLNQGPGKLFLLCDSNTFKYCYPAIAGKSARIAGASVIRIDPGEDSKSMQTAERIWTELLEAGAGRDSLLVNLGGGVVTDLGGFVAAGYKRGIPYINLPTSLVGQCDAAIGGKTGVNLGKIKNQVGFFHLPSLVVIDPVWLASLPEDHLKSGLAEIVKTSLVGNARLWRRLRRRSVVEILALGFDNPFWLAMVRESARFKNSIVEKDFREKKLRKVLNFGHTVGHALETLSMMDDRKHLLHGEAVAAGMVCAAWLSHRKAGLAEKDLEEIKSFLAEGFGRYEVDENARRTLLSLMLHDKKNQQGQFRLTLISEPGKPLVNVACTPTEVMESVDFYSS